MKKFLAPIFTMIASLLILAACTHQGWNYGWSAGYDQWIGRWQGVEGTYLDIAKNGATYKMTIADLDGPQTYYGSPVRDGLEFYRGSELLVIRAGTGKDTGMKWLADKKKCLVVKANEGYCRD